MNMLDGAALALGQKLKTGSIRNLVLYKQNLGEFPHRFITGDEDWVYHYTPATKRQQNNGLDG